MTKKELEREIEHKRLCIFFTERVISEPPTDSLSQAMLRQAERLKAEKSQLETELAKMESETKTVKTKRKRVVRKKKRSKK